MDTDRTIADICSELREKSGDSVYIKAGGTGLVGVTLADIADMVERAVKREMDEAAEFIDDYLREIPIYRPPHDWLIRNGYKDTSYQNDIFEEEKDNE